MSHYRSDRTHAQFLLFDVFGVDRAYGVSRPTRTSTRRRQSEILEQVEAFAHDKLADSFPSADVHPIRLDPVRHTVTLPRDLRASLSGPTSRRTGCAWTLPSRRVRHPRARRRCVGPQRSSSSGPTPRSRCAASSSPPSSPCCTATAPRNSSRLAELILERNWTVTMVLTEPDAGSDVGLGAHPRGPRRRRHLAPHRHEALHHVGRPRCGRERHPTASWPRPHGSRRSQGGPGTKGLSLFIVPVPAVRPRRPATSSAPTASSRPTSSTRWASSAPRPASCVLGGREPADRHPPRRRPRRHPADVRDHHLRPDDGRPQDRRRPVHRAPQRPRLRDEPQAGTRARPRSPAPAAVETARRDRRPPRHPPLAAHPEGLCRGRPGAGALHRDDDRPVRGEPTLSAGTDHGRRRSGTACCCPSSRRGAPRAAGGVLGQESLQVFGGSGLPARLPAWSSTSATPRSTPSTRAPPASRSLDLFERRLVRDRGATAGAAPRRDRADRRTHSRTSPLADGVGASAEATRSAAFRAILEHAFARGRLTRRAAAALGSHPPAHDDGRPHRRLAAPAHRSRCRAWPASSDPSLLTDRRRRPRAGSVAAGRWFARQVLPPPHGRVGEPPGCSTTNRWPCPTRSL
jgi:hypothetical protein